VGHIKIQVYQLLTDTKEAPFLAVQMLRYTAQYRYSHIPIRAGIIFFTVSE
jgi:hypothetical protein